MFGGVELEIYSPICVFGRVINPLKPNGYGIHKKVEYFRIVRSAHIIFMWFVFVWEQTATCATYTINWLVFITETKSVYSAVRTESLIESVSAPSFKGYVRTNTFSTQGAVKFTVGKKGNSGEDLPEGAVLSINTVWTNVTLCGNFQHPKVKRYIFSCPHRECV
jgi:hypothetical protein